MFESLSRILAKKRCACDRLALIDRYCTIFKQEKKIIPMTSSDMLRFELKKFKLE